MRYAFVFLAWMMLWSVGAEEKSVPKNLIDGPLTGYRVQSSPEGYRIENHDAGRYQAVRRVTLNQTEARPLILSVETRTEDAELEKPNADYAIALTDLVFADGSRKGWGGAVSCGNVSGEWKTVSGQLSFAKPIQSLEFRLTYRNRKGVVFFRNPVLQEGMIQKETPPKKEPLKAPQYQKLKDLHLKTDLTKATIVPGDTAACREAAAILSKKWGGRIVAPESAPWPLTGPMIVIGARENNMQIDRLYRAGFCYTDQTYPGKGGYEYRTIHNPTGGGHNVVLCGGSDEEGIRIVARHLAADTPEIGHRMVLKAPMFSKPIDAYDPRHYRAASNGLFGWNYISAMMALFYQTGDENYAREFLRLAFPDQEAQRTFQKFNAESIETPQDPLAGPYHYTGHQMLLLWDLIEEHPFFSDADRLKVTNAFARQLEFFGIGGMMRDYTPDEKPLMTDTRHHQWANICLWVLSRYFKRDYPEAFWERAMHNAEMSFFAANHADGWIYGERGVYEMFFPARYILPSSFFCYPEKCRFKSKADWMPHCIFSTTNGTEAAKVNSSPM